MQEQARNHPSAAGAEQQRSRLPALTSRYLTAQGFTDEEHVRLVQLGLEVITQAEAERRCGKPFGAFSGWTEFMWLPRREPSGKIVRAHGHVVMTKLTKTFTGERLDRERINPDGSVAPNHVSFFGDGWFGYSGEIVVHESWIKAALEHLRTGARTIGLNGINGIRYTDADGEKRLVDEFANPPWSPAATLRIVFDSPDRTSPESALNLKLAKEKLVHTLSETVSAIYDSSVPPPNDTRLSRDINDLYVEIGDAAFSHLARSKRLLYKRAAVGALLVPAGEVVTREPPRWIVHNLVAADELTLIVGPTSCGKSFLTMDLLLAIATGRERWFGNAVRGRGFTVHITLEGAGMSARLRAYQKHHKAGDISKHLLIEVPLNMRDADVVDRVIAAVHDHAARYDVPLAAIAIDTVNRALGGGDENSSVGMGEFVGQVERLRIAFPGSAVLLVHHTGKDESKGARGHSSLSAAVGGELKVEAGDDGARSIYVTKQREGRAQYTLSGFQLDVIELDADSNGDPQSSCVVVPCVNAAPPADDPMALYDHVQRHWAEHINKPVTITSIARSGDVREYCKMQIGSNVTQAQLDAALRAALPLGHLKPKGQIKGYAAYELLERPPTKW